MRQWIIHNVKFTGEEKKVMKLMRKFSSMAHQDYTKVKGIDLVPKKKINPKIFGVMQHYSDDTVAFIAEEPLLDELIEIADYHKVNFQLQYNCWNDFIFGRMDYDYETQTDNSLLFHEYDLMEIDWDAENEVYRYQGAEFNHKARLEKYIFDREARIQRIDLILKQIE